MAVERRRAGSTGVSRIHWAVLRNRFAQRLDTLTYLTLLELRSKNAGTILGFLWWFIEPILLTAVYVGVVGGILGRGGPDYPLFVLCALIPWKWTSGCLNDSIGSIIGRRSILTQSAVSRAFFPSAKVLAHSWRTLMAFPIVVVFAWLQGHPLTACYLWLPVLLCVNLALNWGLSLLLADLGVFVRDLSRLMQFVLRVWFYLSPGLYAMSSVKGTLRTFLALNPMTPLFEGYRAIIMNQSTPDGPSLLRVLVLATAIGLYGFYRIQRNRHLYARVIG